MTSFLDYATPEYWLDEAKRYFALAEREKLPSLREIWLKRSWEGLFLCVEARVNAEGE